MGPIRLFLFRLQRATLARKAGRAQLKAAKNGDREQYLALAASYLDLVLNYFGNTVAEEAETRNARAAQLFQRLWENIAYAERLSDFEYMLARALITSAPERCPITSAEPLVTKLRLLEPTVRFAFIAYEFEKWPFRWVALARRTRPATLHRMLSEARCDLCGIGWHSLTQSEQACLEAISKCLDESPNVRVNCALKERTRFFPRVASIKAEWLELRPELVEVRHRYLPTQAERGDLLKHILASIAETPQQRPPLVHRMVNTVHFSRHAQIRVS